ncbi:unnamed protein product [Ceratitis capitata]|uniref:(Mediterranean fruit fly) hypothetical protein n=1 Tax=Ceratitis capitata TaxID=7213 RepID=A0A811UC85_CERCA|nr:unnamed protein product [Ceratitis capitata]
MYTTLIYLGTSFMLSSCQTHTHTLTHAHRNANASATKYLVNPGTYVYIHTYLHTAIMGQQCHHHHSAIYVLHITDTENTSCNCIIFIYIPYVFIGHILVHTYICIHSYLHKQTNNTII